MHDTVSFVKIIGFRNIIYHGFVVVSLTVILNLVISAYIKYKVI